MSVCKYCGRQLTFTTEPDGVCYVCATYGKPVPHENKTYIGVIGGTGSNVLLGKKIMEILEKEKIDITAINLEGKSITHLTGAEIKVGDTFRAGKDVWTVTEVDMKMEGITISNKKVTLNICHTDKMVYTYDLNGKGLRYLFNFDELDMLNLIRMKLMNMQINYELEKIVNTK